MKVLVMSDSHIVKEDESNTYWCRTAVHGYDFWKRYLYAFEHVNVVSRVQHIAHIDRALYTRADGDGVSFIELPFIRGTSDYIKNFFKLKRIMRSIITDEGRGIFRLPSLPTFMLLAEYKKTKRPYAIEVIIDPEDGYKENFMAKKLFTRMLKRECLRANGVSYVTRVFLQKKYPSHSILHGADPNHFDSYYSSIDLAESFFAPPKEYSDLSGRTLKIIHVASAINSDIKGHTTLLNIVKSLTVRGIPVDLVCVGDGDRRSHYEQMARDLNIDDHVHFLGLFSSKNDLRDLLIASDLMVFPSQAEGLPRAVIEAMAVGLPCLSTPVNGIPELLDEKYLFDPFDTAGFANKIAELYGAQDELHEMSMHNIERAKEYVNVALNGRRKQFYTQLKNISVKQNSGI